MQILFIYIRYDSPGNYSRAIDTNESIDNLLYLRNAMCYIMSE